ncbi:MAG TPA: hypothetical protein VIV12_17780 [Streptosporangiaceae bacterium]
MASVTVERIAAVHAHIADAVIQTSSDSTVPEKEQDRLLRQSCVEACDLLKDWLDGTWWQRMRPSGDGPMGDVAPDQQHFERFLGPVFKDALAVAGRHGMCVSPSLVDEARAAVAATARRHRRMRRQQLFSVANTRVFALQQEVCGVARDLGSRASHAAARTRARAVLAKVSGLLLTLAVAMAGAGPHAMSKNLSEWEHEVVKVVMVHHIGDRAQPNVRIAPPRAGPRPR